MASQMKPIRTTTMNPTMTIAWPRSPARWSLVLGVISRIGLEGEGGSQLLEQRREEGVVEADGHLQRVGAGREGAHGAAGAGGVRRRLAARSVIGRAGLHRGGRGRLRDQDPALAGRRVL